MTGHVRRYKDRWAGVIYIGIVEGKKKQKWVYGDTKKEVQQKVNEMIYQLEHNILTDATNLNVGEYLDEWIELYKPQVAETTYELYKMYINKHIKPAIGSIKLKKIIPMHIQKFYNKKLEMQKGKTVAKYHALLHKAFENALRNNLITVNPCDRVDIPKKEKFVPNYYNENDFLNLLSVVEGTVDKYYIIVAAGLGLRRGEMFGLRWTDIDFLQNTITISNTLVRFNTYIEKDPKNNSSQRTIAAPLIVMDMLREFRNSKKILSMYVFDEFKPQTYSERFKKILIKNNLPIIRFHDLRHYNAIIMLKNGVTDKEAAKRLGHAQVSTLRDIYQHVLQDMDMATADKINDSFMGVQGNKVKNRSVQ